MARLGLVCALVLGLCGAAAGDLQWPDTYTASGEIYLPYGGIAEPFTAYVDLKNGRSRLDTYGSSAIVINRGDVGPYGRVFKIVPETTDQFLNRITCFNISGMQGAAVMAQPVLPNLTSYEFIKKMSYEGMDVDLYYSSFSQGGKDCNYSLMVHSDTQAPVQLFFLGVDRLLGSHYDEYFIKYNSFMTGIADPSVFDHEQKFDCISFPGPGVTDAMAENVLFGLVGAPGYSQQHQQGQVDRDFADFKEKHDKQYASKTEEEQRKTHFRHNHRYIDSMNRRTSTFKLKVNHLADLSGTELRMMRGFRHSGQRNGEQYKPAVSAGDVPTSMNWRLRGAVTPVKDQGICGSCWSFGTTGTIEGSLFLKTNKLVSLSEQAMVDCSWGFGNNGCDGGESERAYQWIMKYGCAPTEASYGQYLMQDGFCHTSQSVCGAVISSYTDIQPRNETALLAAIFEKGPISVAIDAALPTFSFYSHGVYSDVQCGSAPADLDHQVLAVGYGTLNGLDYWLIKNSWSTYWGNDGYLLINRANNLCGVATDASFATIAD